MGTNFYMMTTSKRARDKYLGCYYELTDTPKFGYCIHIAKTSCGWLPLFQSYRDIIMSVSDIKNMYDTGKFVLYDEYGRVYDWDAFSERVLKFNGGVKRAARREKIDGEYVPISHKEYMNGVYEDMYFTDECGYEFSDRPFE